MTETLYHIVFGIHIYKNTKPALVVATLKKPSPYYNRTAEFAAWYNICANYEN